MTQLSLEIANRIIQGSLKKAAEVSAKPIAVVVLTAEGHLKALQRQDGASMFRTDVAIGKAWGAVAMGESSRGLAKKAKENPAFVQALSVAAAGRLLPNPGGVLIRDDRGEILGAVGISGDSGANDEAFAISGIEAAGLKADAGLE